MPDTIRRQIFIIMQTTNLKLLRELRIQEKAIKAEIERVKPLAIEEAQNLAPKDGGKFSIDGVGEFVLDVVPVYDLADYRRYKEEEAKQWRCNRREQRIARTMASSYTASMRTQMNNFIKLYRATKEPDSIDYSLKCVGLE